MFGDSFCHCYISSCLSTTCAEHSFLFGIASIVMEKKTPLLLARTVLDVPRIGIHSLWQECSPVFSHWWLHRVRTPLFPCMFFCFSYFFFDHKLTDFLNILPHQLPSVLFHLLLATSDVQIMLFMKVLLQSDAWRSEQVGLATSFSQALYTID